MSLIDRYVYQVEKKLPKKIRADVSAELHSLLMDALEETLGDVPANDSQAREAAEIQVLEEFGSPEEVAARYKPQHQYIIGPRFLQAFVISAGVVIGVNLFAHLLGAVASTFTGDNFWPALGKLLGSFFVQTLTGIGAATVAFAIAERLIPERDTVQTDTPRQWDPRELPVAEYHSQIKTRWLVFEIAVWVVLLVLFNLFPDQIGSYVSADDRSSFIPLLSSSFGPNYLPLLNLWWGLGIVMNLVILYQGKWTPLTRWVDLVLNVFGLYVLYRLLTGPDILGIDPLWLATNPWAREMAEIQIENLIPLLSTMLKIAIGMGLFFGGIEAFKKLAAALQATFTSTPTLAEKPR